MTTSEAGPTEAGPIENRIGTLDDPVPEVHTLSDDEAVVHFGTTVRRYRGLAAGTDHDLDGTRVRTLSRPPGALLATLATVNDVHFGEVECGRLGDAAVGPVLVTGAGEDPYPEVMNAAVAAEIVASGADLVVAKGDLTAGGTIEQYAAFEATYRPGLGDRLVVTRGNHDYHDGRPCCAAEPVALRHLPGLSVAVVDTSRPGMGGGRLSADQLDALDDIAAAADRPVLVLGHHPAFEASEHGRIGEWTALDAASTAALIALVARRDRIVGYLAGHTHRNRVLTHPGCGSVPFAEVASTKDFPGSWAEYRVYEGGLLALHRRASSPAALAWSERCRTLVFGLYPRFALGTLADRCYPIPLRRT